MNLRKQLTQPFISKSKHVIIDTDAGGDDAQALIYAINEAKKKNIQIIGITCVNGNTFVQRVVKNVAIVQALCGSSIPIYSGAQQSLLCNVQKDYYFSEDGLGTKQEHYWSQLTKDKRLNQSLIKTDLTSAEFIVESAHKYSGDLSVIAIGPLTNLALAYHFDNSIVEKINMVSIMGGAFSGMGIRYFFAAQFNFFLDPQAAKIVIDSFDNVVMCAFDFVLDLDAQKNKPLFFDISTEKGRFINDIYGVIMQKEDGLVCDPLANIAVFSPQLIEGYYEVAAEVELSGLRTKGCVTYDWSNTLNKTRKVKIITRINQEQSILQIFDSYK